MWTLITKHEPPVPPQPQFPADLIIELYPPYNREGQRDIPDDAINPEDPISYCPLLLNEDIHDYDWVDRELRETIYRCSK